jgi:hypothetical protein
MSLLLNMLLLQEAGVTVTLERGGLLISPKAPYFGASLDYLQTSPERCILELKSWSELPEQLPRDAELQVLMQLAIVIEAGKLSGTAAKAVVFAMSPSMLEQRSYVIVWDRKRQQLWNTWMAPKLHMFYCSRIVPQLAWLYGGGNAAGTTVCSAVAAAQPQDERHLSSPQGSLAATTTMDQTPSMLPGKKVSHRKTARVGEVVEVLPCGEKVVVKWDGKELGRKRGMSIAELLVPELLPENVVQVTYPGQRMLVVGGAHQGKDGTLVTLNP